MREKYDTKTPNRFAALKNRNDGANINRAWENIKENTKISVVFLYRLSDCGHSSHLIHPCYMYRPFYPLLFDLCKNIFIVRLVSFTNFNAQFLYFITIYTLHYNPRHVSSSTMLIFRRSYCIITASGIVILCKRPYSTPVESGLSAVQHAAQH